MVYRDIDGTWAASVDLQEHIGTPIESQRTYDALIHDVYVAYRLHKCLS